MRLLLKEFYKTTMKKMQNNNFEEKIITKVMNDLNSNKIDNVSPVNLVGIINTLVQSYNLQESKLNLLVQEIYLRLFEKKGWDRNKARQSWVTASGGDFEGYVRNHINEVLNQKGIVAIKGDTLKKMAKKNKHINEIISFLMLPNKRRCTQTELKIWADNDVIVLTKNNDLKWKVLAVISCKTSDHSRNTSVLFWSLAFVQLGIRYYLSTKDLDNQFSEECSKANKKQRCLFEAYCDRVFSTNPSTKYCSQVKSIILKENGNSDLTDELMELHTIQGNNLKTKITLRELEK